MIQLAIIGTGNVAFHLAKAFSTAKNVLLSQVLGRNTEALRAFEPFAPVSTNLKSIANADVILIAVSDNAIGTIANDLQDTEALVVHTSGSTSIEELSNLKRYGVFYPLQTFSKTIDLEYSKIPFCIEAKLQADLKLLESLATTLNASYFYVNSEKRAALHLAAVFGNNFGNHILTEAEKLCNQNEVPFQLLKPLMQETVKKAFSIGPEAAQTGPAKRGDHITIKKQKASLDNPELQQLYTSLTEAILKHYER